MRCTCGLCRQELTSSFSLASPRPPAVTVTVNQRHVTVKGPRGELKRSFRHLRLEITRPRRTRSALTHGSPTARCVLCERERDSDRSGKLSRVMVRLRTEN